MFAFLTSKSAGILSSAQEMKAKEMIKKKFFILNKFSVKINI
jgi:hypothetical protein